VSDKVQGTVKNGEKFDGEALETSPKDFTIGKAGNYGSINAWCEPELAPPCRYLIGD